MARILLAVINILKKCMPYADMGCARTWRMLGCKDTARVGLQGHGTCWGARLCPTFKETVRMYLTSLRGQYQRERERAGNLHHDQKINDY